MSHSPARPRLLLADAAPGRRDQFASHLRAHFEVIVADGSVPLKELLWLEGPDLLVVDTVWLGGRPEALRGRLAGVLPSPSLPTVLFGGLATGLRGSMRAIGEVTDADAAAAGIAHLYDALRAPATNDAPPSFASEDDDPDEPAPGKSPETVEWLGFISDP